MKNEFAKGLCRVMVAAALAVVGAGSVRADYFVWWQVADNATVSGEFAGALVAYKVPASDSYSAFLQTENQFEGAYQDLWEPSIDGKSTDVTSGRLMTDPNKEFADYADYSFRIQLYDADEKLIAFSDALSLSSLSDMKCVFSGTGTTIHGTWAPTVFHAVPEPTSGLLVLLGLAGLALKRGKMAVKV